ncbi:hypothetical protein BOX15_Mlig021119g2 [Macrostomum lignano]|uniref:Uncharacterized protein n=1 Tax=Macrostomum lignano TaxID=282301 RepID=A0A267FIA8_9PLAT|nr:hypothetical protein BOX15_Mlig021119g2 [Macrostomum lignano]
MPASVPQQSASIQRVSQSTIAWPTRIDFDGKLSGDFESPANQSSISEQQHQETVRKAFHRFSPVLIDKLGFPPELVWRAVEDSTATGEMLSVSRLAVRVQQLWDSSLTSEDDQQ